MAAAKAFLPMFLLLASLALIPYETAAARYLLEGKREIDYGALDPKRVPVNHPGKPYTRGCHDAYCRGRNPVAPPGP